MAQGVTLLRGLRAGWGSQAEGWQRGNSPREVLGFGWWGSEVPGWGARETRGGAPLGSEPLLVKTVLASPDGDTPPPLRL